MGEGEKLIWGRAKPSPRPPDCRCAAASRWIPTPVRSPWERGLGGEGAPEHPAARHGRRFKTDASPCQPPQSEKGLGGEGVPARPPATSQCRLRPQNLPLSARDGREGKHVIRGRGWLSPKPPGCRCAAASRRLPDPRSPRPEHPSGKPLDNPARKSYICSNDANTPPERMLPCTPDRNRAATRSQRPARFPQPRIRRPSRTRAAGPRGGCSCNRCRPSDVDRDRAAHRGTAVACPSSVLNPRVPVPAPRRQSVSRGVLPCAPTDPPVSSA